MSVEKPNPYQKHQKYEFDDESTMTISWDAFSEEIHFVVDLPSDSMLALAFG